MGYTILGWSYFLSGILMREVLSRKGYNSVVRVLGTAIAFYVGPIAFLCLICMGGKNEKS